MKIPGVGPDVEQAISHLFKLTLLHNSYPIFLGFGMVCVLIWSLYKPSRSKILLFIGLALLLLHFEYIKHIMEGLRQQTLITVTTETPRYRFMWIMEKIVTRIVPLGLFAGGLGSIVASFVFLRKEGKMGGGHMAHPHNAKSK